VKEARRGQLMKAQERISEERLARRAGRSLTVLVDALTLEGAIARSSADAPEIDGVVHVAPHAGLRVGDFARVRVTRTGAHDLWAEVLEKA